MLFLTLLYRRLALAVANGGYRILTPFSIGDLTKELPPPPYKYWLFLFLVAPARNR